MYYLTKFVFLIFVFFHLGQLKAQKEANNWYFGYNAGITFNTNPPTALTNGKLRAREGCASMSTFNGRLLFYTNGLTVWDSTHNIMQNGSGLKADSSTTQATVIVPHPDSTHIYYIFTQADAQGTNGFQYSEVNMKLNGGKGGIVPTKKNILLQKNTCEKISVVQHADRRGYWVLVSQFGSDSFFSYHISSSGLNLIPVGYKTGYNILSYENNNKVGYLKISPDGKKVAYSTYWLDMDTIAIGDFDATTGKISNLWKIYSPYVYGLEFSPLGKYLYTSSDVTQQVEQYDLSAPDKATLIASKQVLNFGAYSGYQCPGALQLGPDGKIYLAIFNTTSLSVIHAPDSAGASCRPQKDYLPLASRITMCGLPNFCSSIFQPRTFLIKKNCLNDTVNFEMAYTYNLDSAHWDFGDPASGNSNTSKKIIGAYHVYSKTGFYNVRLISFFRGYKDTITLKFYYKNRQHFLGKDTTLCNASKLVLKSSEIFSTYQWSNGATAAFTTASKTGSYILNVTDVDGCNNADTIQVAFSKVDAQFQLSDTLLCFKNHAFKVKDTSLFTGSTRLKSIWYFGDNTFKADTIATKTYLKAGTYQIKLLVESINHCKDSISKSVSVINNKIANFTINDSTQCLLGNAFNFTNTSTIGSGGTYTFQWLLGDSTFSTEQHIISQQYLKDSSYPVQLIIDINGLCKDTVQKAVVVYPTPKADFTASKWVQCLNNNSTDFTNLSQVKSGTLTHQWNLGDKTSSLSKNILGKKYLSADSFFVSLLTVSNNGCWDSIMKVMHILPSVSAAFTVNKDTQCFKGHQLVLKPLETQPMKALWQLGNGDSLQTLNQAIVSYVYNQFGTYTIRHIATHSNNCKDTVSKIIRIRESPKASFIIQDSLPCLDNSLLTIITNSVSSNPAALNQWVVWGDGVLNNQTGNYSITHIYGKDSTYLLTLVSAMGFCFDTLQKPITVALRRSVQLFVKGFCLGDTTYLTALSKGQSNAYRWQINNNNIARTDSLLKLVLPIIGPYQIKVSTSSQLCAGRDSANIAIVEKPIADFSYVRLNNFNTGYLFHFTDQSSKANTWNWNFGNSGFSNTQHPDFKFKDTGYKHVQLIVSNQQMCFDTAEKIIPVLARIQFFFPTAFSPNGNGINDDFGLNSNQYYLVKTYHLEIFNRWGEKVFQTEDVREHWLSAAALTSASLSKREGPQQGVYLFKAIITDILDERQEITGAVEVLR